MHGGVAVVAADDDGGFVFAILVEVVGMGRRPSFCCRASSWG